LQELSKLTSRAHQAEFFTLAGLVERRLGRWTETVRDSEKALELDPQDVSLAVNLVQTLSGMKRYGDAERVADAAILRVPPLAAASLWNLKNELELARGNVPAARAALEAASAKDNMEYEQARLWLCLFDGGLAAAKGVVASAGPEVSKTAAFWLVLGTIARAGGATEDARNAFEETRRMALASLEKRPDNAEALTELAVADAALGRKDEARDEARRAVEILPITKDAVAGPMVAAMRAEVFAWVGDREAALNLLNELVEVPFGPSYGDLKLDPTWNDLRGDRRFDEIVARSASLLSSIAETESARP
jgi:tetratricopeptide (TPR) repeat protein